MSTSFKKKSIQLLPNKFNTVYFQKRANSKLFFAKQTELKEGRESQEWKEVLAWSRPQPTFPKFSSALRSDPSTRRIWYALATAHDLETHDKMTEKKIV
jgi:hypothetical protein